MREMCARKYSVQTLRCNHENHLEKKHILKDSKKNETTRIHSASVDVHLAKT